MKNTVLVTGGAGYIGSHACKALAAAGYTPVVYDNLSYGHEWAVKWGPLEVGDIGDHARLQTVIRKHQPVAVMHFAAFAYVGESVANPLKYYRNNVAGTLTLIEEMLDAGIDKMVFSSTCATYGIPEEIPIKESHVQQPVNPYGASKLMVERLLRDAGSAHGLRSISLRYFNAGGADPDGEVGESHDPETHLIPLVLDAAIGRRPFITVYGGDYPTVDGTCIRDYIHVSDLAMAHVHALQALESGSESRAYNLGNGQGFSVCEIIEMAEKITGKTITLQWGDRRTGDPPILVGDSSRIRDELGWKPKFERIESIIETAWVWHGLSRPRN